MYQISYPETEITKQHIVNYDKLREFDSRHPVKYFAFPQRGTTMFFLKNALVESNDHSIVISKSKEENVQVVFLGKYINPLFITYKDFVEEIAVNFNETGITYFFPEQWSASSLVQVLDATSIGLDAEQLFSSDNEASINYLEGYLTKRYSDLKISGVEKAIAIINNDPGCSVAHIAEKVFLTEKTLNRQFQKYVGCTISKYKSIIRFRSTIDTHFKNSQLSLTELCLENNYFDSPHFYKEIKKIASFNPKDFFNKVEANGVGSYPYIFE